MNSNQSETKEEMDRFHRRLTIGCIIVFVILLPLGCLHMEKLTPIAGNNCVDYVLANKKAGDTLIWGRYTPMPEVNHIWLERNGTCYDNMNKAGFNCNSVFYEANEACNPQSTTELLTDKSITSLPLNRSIISLTLLLGCTINLFIIKTPAYRYKYALQSFSHMQKR